MNINLHNYEEYFLLYADNELSREDRFAVEDFVKQYPHLEEEFNMIKSTIMVPEKFQLKDKSFLLKSGDSEFINEQNFEEIFVLFHDEELSEKQKEITQVFVEKHPELKEEFLLIGKAKIQGDAVAFPDKKSLIRKEHSAISGRIIMFRSLAAAVVLGFGLWMAVSYFNGETVQPQLAQQSKLPDTDISNNRLVENKSGHTDKSEITIEKMLANSEGLTRSKESEKNNQEQKEEVLQKNKNLILAKNITKPSDNLQSDKKAMNSTENKNVETGNERMIAQIPQKEMSAPDIAYTDKIAHVDLDITEMVVEKKISAQNVVYLDVNKEPSGDYLFYNIPADEFKKTKVGGFLKKLKRVAERNDPIKRFVEIGVGQVASSK